MSDINYDKLFSTAAMERLGTMGARRGLGGVGGPQVKFSFEGGMPDPSTFPMEGIADATRRALQKDPLALNYGSIMGFDGMRDQVIEMEKIFGGHVPSRDNIMITSGASQALHLAYGALINAGDTIILESESYIAQQVKMYNPRVETVSIDAGGPSIAAFTPEAGRTESERRPPESFSTPLPAFITRSVSPFPGNAASSSWRWLMNTTS